MQVHVTGLDPPVLPRWPGDRAAQERQAAERAGQHADREEGEPERERVLARDVGAPQHDDERRLAQADAVERDGHDRDEEEHRAEHEQRCEAEVEVHAPREEVDRDRAHALGDDAESEDQAERARMARGRRAARGRASAAAPRCAAAPRAGESGRSSGRARTEKSASAASTVAATTPRPSATAVPRPMPVPPARAPAAASAPSAREPDDAIDEHRGHGLGARAGAAREVDRPHRVAADRRRQDLAQQQRDRVRLEEPPEAGVATSAREQQQVPAQRHDAGRDDVDRDRREEPGRARVAQRVADAVQVGLPQHRGDQHRPRAPPGAPAVRAGSSREVRVQAAHGRDDVVDVAERMGRRERQREHLGTRGLGHRQRPRRDATRGSR